MADQTTEDPNCVVNTKEGPVRGYVDKRDDGTYYTFKSIPYAKPPIGNLRFMHPQPVTPWTEELDCTKESPTPLSVGQSKVQTGSEDCLYLEVITPNMNPDKPLPVMFRMASYVCYFFLGKIYDPALIIDRGVVYVHCNAREGPFGFLSINDISAPGNAGLKDFVFALKWVQRNIKAFGGDPDNVTIYGSSTGGVMVHLMVLSPMATGLFHKAIIQSAAALSYWTVDRNPTANVAALASKMGMQTTCMVSIVEELKLLSQDELMKILFDMADEYFANTGFHIDTMFKPSIEQEFEGQPAFITKSPPMIIKSGNFNKVQIIIGCYDMEALVLEYVYGEKFYHYEKLNENINLVVPCVPLSRDDKSAKVVGKKLMNFYLEGEGQFNKDTKKQYLQLVSDYCFFYFVNNAVKLHAAFGPECPIYYYIMSYEGDSLPKDLKYLNSLGYYRELEFLFRIALPDSSPCKGTRDFIKTRSRVLKMWTNFAKYGHPTPDDDDPLLEIKWDPVENENKLNYLGIGSELTKGRNPCIDRIEFWDELQKQYSFLKLCFFQDLGIIRLC